MIFKFRATFGGGFEKSIADTVLGRKLYRFESPAARLGGFVFVPIVFVSSVEGCELDVSEVDVVVVVVGFFGGLPLFGLSAIVASSLR